MTDIVERLLNVITPSKLDREAANEIANLRVEVKMITAGALAAMEKVLDESATLRAENERLREALNGVLWMAEEWFKNGGDETTFASDYEKQLEEARAALQSNKIDCSLEDAVMQIRAELDEEEAKRAALGERT